MSRYCDQCGKARKACLCASIRRIPSDSDVIILQHSSEVHRALGTARILALSLERCTLLVGEDFSQCDALNALINDEHYQCCVLFPSEQAHRVNNENTWRDVNKPLRIIILDGTWKKAYKMWQLATNLHHLTMIQLPLDLIGNYRIRKAPTANSLSTVEAGFHLLRLIEPQRDFSPLMDAFDAMIAYQIAQMPEGVFERNYSDSNRA
ncbi:DTW domain-containing protein [Vibrio sp. SM6]|uniref:tRNA-uridine aminocarboxypropyltransferase n=1 Tax=Vibrio agarilyticus TaxID=2726741 RepID=A0A7X8TSK9_9VIBR|nr:DTW domain-containing protein [Vibrio agarilyticus]